MTTITIEVTDEERERIMDYIFEKNAELYRRLA